VRCQVAVWQDEKVKGLFGNIPRGSALLLIWVVGTVMSGAYLYMLINKNGAALGISYSQLLPAYFLILGFAFVVCFLPNKRESDLRKLLNVDHPDLPIIKQFQSRRPWVSLISIVFCVGLQLSLGATVIDSGKDIGRFGVGNAGIAGMTCIGIWGLAAWWKVRRVLFLVRDNTSEWRSE
jgi:hypothetical protein